MEIWSKKDIDELTAKYPLYSQEDKGGDALALYHLFIGSARLGARIWDLKHKRGVKIEKHMVSVKNRYGEDCKVAMYKLAA